MLRVIASALFASIVLAAEESARDRLVKQAAYVRQTGQTTATFKAALRDWIETRLPASRAEMLRSIPKLQSALTDELTRAGLLLVGNLVINKPGYVDRIEIFR